jgi:hypothetical protein
MASAIAPISNLNMANSLLYDSESRSLKVPASYCFPRNAFAGHFVPRRPGANPNGGETSFPTYRNKARNELATDQSQGEMGLVSMLCAPIPHSLRSDSLIRTHDAINGMTLE